jgi:hypothetical protein
MILASLKRFAAGAVTVGLALAACGKSESKSSSAGGSGGSSSGGTGGSSNSTGGEAGSDNGEPADVMCGDTLCEGKSLGIPGGPQSDACCNESGSDEPCGIKTDFLEEFGVELDNTCQQLNSPGDLDENCPVSPPLMISSLGITFPGCCLPSGKCGFLLDSALGGAIRLDLGCLDASQLPNPDVGDPPDCDPGSLGQAGAGGQGGAGG